MITHKSVAIGYCFLVVLLLKAYIQESASNKSQDKTAKR